MSGAPGIDRDTLGAWLARQRWFAGKTQGIAAIDVEDRIALGGAVVTIVGVTLDGGGRQRYAVPLGPGAAVADALDDGTYVRALLDLVGQGGRVAGERGEIVGLPTRVFPAALDAAALPAQRVAGEQSNTSVVIGDTLIVKHFRRLAEGRNPEEEIGRFLAERTDFAHAPRLAGHAEYRPRGGETSALAVVHELVQHTEDGWEWMLRALRDDRPTIAALAALGTRTAELHRALASRDDETEFAPQPITPADLRAWATAVERQVEDARRVLGGPPGLELPDIAAALDGLAGRSKIRHHGDYHLGQTRHGPRDEDWVILDFEGEPLRPLAERRARHTPLRDVAGMLRSIDYAAAAAIPRERTDAADRWRREASGAFVSAYRTRAAGSPFVPLSDAAFERAVSVFVVEKAAYEVVYEASHRPDWLEIPRRGLTAAAAALTPRARSA